VAPEHGRSKGETMEPLLPALFIGALAGGVVALGLWLD
jgi:hypothetical protein